MASVLREQAADGLFYDEYISAVNSIRYGQYMSYFDLGNMASLFSAVNIEITEDELDKDHIRTGNAHSDADITDRINGVIEDKSLVYARGTDGIISRDKTYRKAGGELELGNLFTSGMYIYFASQDVVNRSDIYEYFDEMNKALDMMPVRDDGRYQFLKDYTDVVTDYALIANAGTTVNWLINEENVDKADIDYERVREYWTDGDESKTYSDWTWRQWMSCSYPPTAR